jgi:hypothetical protein
MITGRWPGFSAQHEVRCTREGIAPRYHVFQDIGSSGGVVRVLVVGLRGLLLFYALAVPPFLPLVSRQSCGRGSENVSWR